MELEEKILDYGFMKYSSNYESLKYPIDWVLEIRLKQEVWEKVVRAAGINKRTYSTIVRFCVFRLIGHHKMKLKKEYPVLKDKRTEIRNGDMHRHRLCLYGEDELYIRLAAVQLGCSMTHLVRIALDKYLDSCLFFKKGFGRTVFYWLSYKKKCGVEFHTFSSYDIRIFFKNYSKKEYW